MSSVFQRFMQDQHDENKINSRDNSNPHYVGFCMEDFVDLVIEHQVFIQDIELKAINILVPYQ